MGQDKDFDLSASELKLIAMLSMLLDHVGYTLLPQAVWLRVLGRLAFPIFAFQAAEGYRFTKDFRRYCRRLLIFALISEIPYDLMIAGRIFAPGAQNVMFTLLLGLLSIRFLEQKRYLLLTAALVAAGLWGCDYGLFGVLMVLSFHIFRQQPVHLVLALLLINGVCYGGIQFFALAALVPISLYRGRKGCGRLQPVCYWFYPMHMLVLTLI